MQEDNSGTLKVYAAAFTKELVCMRLPHWRPKERTKAHVTRSVFDRYNIVGEADVRGAGERLEEYARQRKQEQAAQLRRVK